MIHDQSLMLLRRLSLGSVVKSPLAGFRPQTHAGKIFTCENVLAIIKLWRLRDSSVADFRHRCELPI